MESTLISFLLHYFGISSWFFFTQNLMVHENFSFVFKLVSTIDPTSDLVPVTKPVLVPVSES